MEEALLHCAKVQLRARPQDPAAQIKRSHHSTCGHALANRTAGAEAAEIDADEAGSVRTELFCSSSQMHAAAPWSRRTTTGFRRPAMKQGTCSVRSTTMPVRTSAVIPGIRRTSRKRVASGRSQHGPRLTASAPARPADPASGAWRPPRHAPPPPPASGTPANGAGTPPAPTKPRPPPIASAAHSRTT